ncbi:MAG: hypothetical protein Q9168_004862 [Polycauliona sp. 1 TL-2023]
MASSSTIQSLIEQISHVDLQSTHDSLQLHTRQDLQGLTKQLGFALETPFETMNRLVILPFQHAVVRVAIDLKLFASVEEAGASGRNVDEIEADTGVDAILLLRLLRTLAAIGLLRQVDEQHWAATNLTHSCTNPTVESGLKFMFDFIGPVFQSLPPSLAKRKYRCPTATEGPLQDAYDTKLAGWELILNPQFSESLKDCNAFMKGRREGSASWLQFYPFAENIMADAASEPEAVLVVDVGGGLGHGLVEIQEKFPACKGRLLLQDLPKTVEQAETNGGIFEPMAHDIFASQPIQGPKIFLIRQVLHDWPDQECREILGHLVAAMRPSYSKILINEFVAADTGPSDFITAIDLVMMGLSGGMERTESQWCRLLSSAGLRIEKIWTLNPETESVIEAVLDDPSFI